MKQIQIGRRLVFVADIHGGNQKALTPESWFNEKTNAFQIWVWEKWKEFCKKYNNPNDLIIAGDAVDGPGVKSLGVEQITTSINKQCEMVDECVKLIVGTDTIIHVVNGSGYHGGDAQAVKADKMVSDKLTETYGKDRVHFQDYNFKIDLGKELIQVAHGAGGSIANPDSYLRAEMTRAKDNALNNGVRCPSILVRAHTHIYRGILSSSINGYSIPCWEFTTDFMEKKTANSTPNIGGLIIDEIGDIFLTYPELYKIPEEVQDAMHSTIILERKEKRRYNRIHHLADVRGLMTNI